MGSGSAHVAEWLKGSLAELGVEDPITLSEYILGILESSDGDTDQVAQVLEPYVDDADAISEFIDELRDEWGAGDVDSELKEGSGAGNSITDELLSKWSQQRTPDEAASKKDDKPQRAISRIDEEERALTLRLAQQIQEMRIQEQIQEDLAAASEGSTGEESIAAKNRAMVQAKIAQAQQAKEASIRKHKAESKAAAASDKKDKAQRKEERQKKALKGERRRG